VIGQRFRICFHLGESKCHSSLSTSRGINGRSIHAQAAFSFWSVIHSFGCDTVSFPAMNGCWNASARLAKHREALQALSRSTGSAGVAPTLAECAQSSVATLSCRALASCRSHSEFTCVLLHIEARLRFFRRCRALASSPCIDAFAHFGRLVVHRCRAGALMRRFDIAMLPFTAAACRRWPYSESIHSDRSSGTGAWKLSRLRKLDSSHKAAHVRPFRLGVTQLPNRDLFEAVRAIAQS
jgi:hypothetical protein